MGKLILDPVIGTFSYLLFVGRADVEAGHNDSCPWHQVEFGVGGPIVSRPEGRETNKALKKKWTKEISVVKYILEKIWTILLLNCSRFHFTELFSYYILKQEQLQPAMGQIKVDTLGERKPVCSFHPEGTTSALCSSYNILRSAVSHPITNQKWPDNLSFPQKWPRASGEVPGNP